MIQVGIIGSGFIGPAHLEALRRVGDIEVVALCDGSLEVAQQKARQLNVAHAYGSVEALLAHPGLQVVHNCTPNHLHARINRQILSAGLHVFSEKPLCMTTEEARELVALAESAGVVHGVSFVYRQFAMVQQAAAMMRNGDVGRLFAAHGSYLQDWMLLESDYNWRVDSAQGGASRAMADIGSHWCDTVQFMTDRRIVEVMADLSIVRCSLAWDQEVPQRLWIGHRQRPNQLLSDDPSLMLGEAAASAHFPGGHNEGWPDAFKNMMLSFYQAVRAGRMPPASSRRFASFYEGADVMYIIAAIVKSHQQQRWVKVER